MSEQSIDFSLIEEVKKGNKHAFDVLVLKYQNRLIKLVHRYISDHSEVMDVVQESFIKAYRALPNFRGKSSFYTWLYRIAVNTAKNHVLQLSRKPPGMNVDLETAEQISGHTRLKDYATPEGFLVRDEVEETVLKALNNLPDELRTAIILRELKGLSYANIAKEMGCPLGTVRSRIFRARELIDEKLKPLIDKK